VCKEWLDYTLVCLGVVGRCPDSIAEKSNYLIHKRTHANILETSVGEEVLELYPDINSLSF